MFFKFSIELLKRRNVKKYKFPFSIKSLELIKNISYVQLISRRIDRWKKTNLLFLLTLWNHHKNFQIFKEALEKDEWNKIKLNFQLNLWNWQNLFKFLIEFVKINSIFGYFLSFLYRWNYSSLYMIAIWINRSCWCCY